MTYLKLTIELCIYLHWNLWQRHNKTCSSSCIQKKVYVLCTLDIYSSYELYRKRLINKWKISLKKVIRYYIVAWRGYKLEISKRRSRGKNTRTYIVDSNGGSGGTQVSQPATELIGLFVCSDSWMPTWLMTTKYRWSFARAYVYLLRRRDNYTKRTIIIILILLIQEYPRYR